MVWCIRVNQSKLVTKAALKNMIINVYSNYKLLGWSNKAINYVNSVKKAASWYVRLWLFVMNMTGEDCTIIFSKRSRVLLLEDFGLCFMMNIDIFIILKLIFDDILAL